MTGRATSILDAVIDLGEEAGAKVLDRALQRDAVTLEALREAQAALCARPGAELVRRLLSLAAGGARFEAERLAHDLLRSEGIRGWDADVEVVVDGCGRALLDVAFVGLRVAVEIDGWAFHRDQRAFVRDQVRQNALTAAGWTVLRTNWFELTTSPRVFLDALRAVLADRSGCGQRHAE